jgi:hypothetical protein
VGGLALRFSNLVLYATAVPDVAHEGDLSQCQLSKLHDAGDLLASSKTQELGVLLLVGNQESLPLIGRAF